MGTCCATNRIGTAPEENGETITQKADSMQQVLDKIYMGSAVAAKNKQLLLNNGITHIIAIGWNLETHFESDFKYLLINKVEDSPECLILNHFEKCFNFIEQCFNDHKNNKLFVHCHKGLSRSATIVIGYEMYRNKTDFDTVLHEIRKNRSFIMPNIGFQAQLHEFKHQNYSLDMSKYQHFHVISFIQQELPRMAERIEFNYNAYKTNPNEVDEDELFELTLYTHQVHKLKQKEKLNDNDIKILNDSIQILRKIQVEFVQNESSIKRFDIMFRNNDKKKANGSTASNTKTITNNTNDRYGSLPSSSLSAINREEVPKLNDMTMPTTTDTNEQKETSKANGNAEDGDDAEDDVHDDEFPDDPQKSESQKLIAT